MKTRATLSPSDVHYCAKALASILGACDRPEAALNQILRATARQLQHDELLAADYVRRLQTRNQNDRAMVWQ